ncbi:MAG: hypothetical protein M1819_005278 [Sarea resinae]|nr:MAG: hypothetical protein M1819_005278 [Sarea resinae]
MSTFSTVALFVALRFLLLLGSPSSLVGALPTGLPSYNFTTSANTSAINSTHSLAASAGSDYWLANIQRQGTVAFGNSSYTIFRNVMDYGAAGDGVTDDTDAINSAISSGSRCGSGCDSSTTTPALVYFPPGTYLVSAPIIQYYYTQLVGDAVTIPTLKAAAGFSGMAVIDSDPYDSSGDNWYTNQNNFYRQVRNFVIDLTAMPSTSGTGIHWQVAQATSLQNIVFNMIKGTSSKQQGVFMDNGSGGFMTDLVFNGGNYGAFFGNQQFMTRNMTFNNCNTAVFMNWDWVWTLKSLSINNCGVGIDISEGGDNTTVGSVLIQDSTITNTPVGIQTSFDSTSLPTTGGTLIIDNVDFSGSAAAVADTTGTTILAGDGTVASWAQGNEYTTSSHSRTQGTLTAPSKPSNLLNGGNFFERAKPQYESLPASSFVSVKSAGAKGDGTTDDTAAIQAAMNSLSESDVLYFDHGAYIISSTVKVPANIKITGEIWPLIMASGSAFQDPTNPAPVFQVGQAGDSGAVEMSDLIFQTVGAQPGAVMIEWNVAESSQGASGMWDVHMRIGGSAGTELQSTQCAKDTSQTTANSACEGAFLLLHVTSKATIYLENNWFWVADHELDLSDHGQISVYNGRGVLIESADGPVWMYGTSAEHSQLYNYQLNNAGSIYMAMVQTETPYYQSDPNALTPFKPGSSSDYSDPDFSDCTTDSCRKSWGLRIVDSSDVLIYGTGLYSFFDNYEQTCLDTESCQDNMISIEGTSSSLNLYGVSTKAATNMITVKGSSVALQSDNSDTFCQTIASFTD